MNNQVKVAKSSKRNKNLETFEEFEESEVMSKLNLIQRTVHQIQRQQTINPGRFNVHKNTETEFLAKSAKVRHSRESEDDSIKDLIKNVQATVDKFPVKEIKNSHFLNRKQEKNLENLNEILKDFEEKIEKLQICCLKNDGNEGKKESNDTIEKEQKSGENRENQEEPSRDQSSEEDGK